MVHAVDRGVGKMVAALKETKKLDNTLIVFFSDNGETHTAPQWFDSEKARDQLVESDMPNHELLFEEIDL